MVRSIQEIEVQERELAKEKKEVKRLCKEFGFTAGLLRRAHV